jgi:hypothetical protein
VDRAAVLPLGVGPVALVSVTFASPETVDVRLATSVRSWSMAVSLVLSCSC